MRAVQSGENKKRQADACRLVREEGLRPHKLHIARLAVPARLAHSAARPSPTTNALLVCGGDPKGGLRTSSEQTKKTSKRMSFLLVREEGLEPSRA